MFLRHVWRQFDLQRTMSYYAVAKGRKVGIYDTWKQCEEQVSGFKGASYKKFKSKQEAELFIGGGAQASTKFSPQNEAVALGSKGPPPATWSHTIKNTNNVNTKETTDFWPEDDDDDAFNEDDMTENDLVAALTEVEGIPGGSSTDNRKRKISDGVHSHSKLPKHESRISEPAGIKRIGIFDFLIDSEGFVIVYTDGSCLGNGKTNASAGYGVYFGDDHPLNAAKPVRGRVTNNVGEIQAAIHAIKSAVDVGITKLCINTDSQFLINSITLWVNGWKKRNWRLKNNQPVKNVDDFKELDDLIRKHDVNVKWIYVKGHEGIKGNEMADKLAREGATLYAQRNKTE